MESFCNGSPFWDLNLTWNGAWPQFTECFQHTALVWVPCGMLWLVAIFYILHLLSCRTNFQPLGIKYITKLLTCTLIILLAFVDLARAISTRQSSIQTANYFQADVVAPTVYIITMVLVVVLILLERKKDFIISPVLFVFWFSLLIANIIPFYSKIILKEYVTDVFGFFCFYLFYLFVLIEFIVHCFPEKPVGLDVSDKRTCKEIQASVLSRISFQWISSLVVKGYKKPLTEEDIENLNPRDQSATVVPSMLYYWNQQVRQAQHKTAVYHSQNGVHSLQQEGADEVTPLLSASVTVKSGHSRTSHQPSLMIALWCTFGRELLQSHIWKLLFDTLILCNPLILGALVTFVQDMSAHAWQGYIFAAGLFISIMFQSIFFHQLQHQSLSLGLRVKAALLSVIYRKALRISSAARKESTIGETVNLMSVDACHISDVIPWLWCLWSSTLQCCLSLYLLYTTLGVSMFAGLGFLLFLFPINGTILVIMGSLQTQLMAFKDQRMKIINEVLNGIKILKLYAWESSFKKKVSDVRDNELRVLWRSSILSSVMTFSWTAAPFMVGFLTFLTFVLTDASHWLSPEKAFVSISYFNILRFAINILPMILTDSIKAVVSVRRINKYLNNEELDPHNIDRICYDGSAICIENGTFTWSEDSEPTLRNINLRVPKGSLVAVVGMVGAGKSSLLSAILGDMDKIQGHVCLQGTVAYVPQQAWIQNDTLRNNILFSKPMNQTRYQKVLEACALIPDLAILPARDETEIGERGINLSGGQKQRVSLARAVYNDTDVYLLDDPLSAVDSHVGKHIFQQVVGNTGLLKNTTRVLVTHGVHWLPMVDRIFVIDGGCISETGSYAELISHDGPFAKFLSIYFSQGAEEEDDEDEEVAEMKKLVRQRLESIRSDDDVFSDDGMEKKQYSPTDRKLERQISATTIKEEMVEKGRESNALSNLIEEEKVATGTVKRHVFVAYIRSMGVTASIIAALAYMLYQASAVAANIWLSKWTDDVHLANFTYLPANSSERHDHNSYYLGVYGGIGVAEVSMIIMFTVIARVIAVRASRILHWNMLAVILRSPMSFFDTTPTGRIVNRFSMDMDVIDTSLPLTIEFFLDCMSAVLATFVVISYSTPIFMAVIIPLVILYFFIQRYYVTTAGQLKRLESKSRSPIYNHFGETLAGVSVIRAYEAQERFISELERRVDLNQCCSFNNYSSNRWLALRGELLGNMIVFLAAIFAVIAKDSISGGVVGLSISYALEITTSLNFLVRMACDLETQIIAVERVKEYSELSSEADWDRGRMQITEGWPQQGDLQFSSYSTRYREGLNLVLKNITCNIQPREKVGIVGRTGAGKSSLTLALFRLIEPASGSITIDDLDISLLGLHQVRSRLTILPQDPVLFAGTLRMNLDPFDKYSDAEVWAALEHAHLKAFVSSLPKQLDHDCGEGGENLSVGQRQLLCLGRTLLRKTKVLIFDEATAAVDLETDDLIQKTIRSEFKDCTVLTIAHRLNTVMDYDRILVLDKGEIAEFDSPNRLLERTGGIFYQMAKDARLIK